MSIYTDIKNQPQKKIKSTLRQTLQKEKKTGKYKDYNIIGVLIYV